MMRTLTVILITLLNAGCWGADLTTLPQNTWVAQTPAYVGMPNGGVLAPNGWNNKGAYDPASQRVLVFDRWGDADHGASIYANALLAYDPAANVVSVLKINNWHVVEFPTYYQTVPLAQNSTDPTPVDRHPLADFTLDPTTSKVYLSNGYNSSAAYGGIFGNPITDTWAFSLSTQTWSFVSDLGSTNPPFAGPQIMTYDPANQVVALFSDDAYHGAQTWLLNVSTGTWRAVDRDPSCQNVHTSGSACCYDSRRNRILVFGGGLDHTDSNPHLWAYDTARNTWTPLADCPEPAPLASFDYDSNHDICLALIGNDTWSYDPNSNSWTQIAAPINVTYGHSLTYDAAHDVFVYEGVSWSDPNWYVFRYSGAAAPPQITKQPLDAAVLAPQTATFTVTALGGMPLSYRWQRFNGAAWMNIDGAQNWTYVTPPATTADDGDQFRCVVSNSVSSVVSDPATLIVSAPVQFNLTVVNGSGSGAYGAGVTVTISAESAPAGWIFASWVGGTVLDSSSATTMMTMPAADITVTATYEKVTTPVQYALLVNNGSGSGQYTAGSVVTITANPPDAGQRFSGWTGAAVRDANATTTTLTMPAANASVTATYATITRPTLTIAKLTGRVSFATQNHDSFAIAASVDAASSAEFRNGTILLNVGGATVAFQLTKNGIGRKANGTIAVSASTGKVSIKAAVKNGDWKAAWATYGVTNATVKNRLVSMPVTLSVNGVESSGVRQVRYSCKVNSSGVFQ